MFKNYLLIFLILLLSFSCYCQNFSKTEIYSWYDNQTGIENSSLFRGMEYVEVHRMINEKHKFFDDNKFLNSSLVYDGQLYTDVPLKFNVYDDVVMVNLKQEQRNSIFQLFSDKVTYFKINNYKFNYIAAENTSSIRGFYEVISEDGDFKIFKKHKKNRTVRRDKSVAYMEFTKSNPDYVFQFDEELYSLTNRRELFSQFPNHKKEIRAFYKENKKLSKDRQDVFMSRLADKMNSIVLTASNDIQE